MSKKIISNLMSTFQYIGAIGYLVCNHLNAYDAIVHNILMTLLIIGLIGTALLRWMEQRAKGKGKGKRTEKIASTAYLIFIVIICAWAILEKLGII